MKIFLKILFILILPLVNTNIIAQNFHTSNYLAGSGNIRLSETLKTIDGVFLLGSFTGTLNNPETLAAESFDVFFAKYDNNFNPIWIKHIGGDLFDFARDITLDSEKNLYILGSFQGSCSFDGGVELLSDGEYDVFLAKYSHDGSLKWAKKIAFNAGSQTPSSITFDGDDLIISGNYTDSISFGGTSFISDYGMFFSKFDLNGDLLWVKNIPKTSTYSTLESVSAFSDGYYLNGRLRGTASFDLGDYTSNNISYADVFLYKTDFNGNGQWLRRSYGDGNAFTGTITQDNYGNIYYTGLFNGTGIEVDSTASLISHNIENNGSSDIFIFKYNKNGNLIWANGYGKEGSDWARDINFTNNFLYNTGYFSDTIIFDQDTLISSSSSDQDAFIGVFDTKGNPLRASKIEDSDDGNESGMTLSIDSDNYIYWGGTFRSTSVLVGDSTFINPNPGNQCVFFTKGSTPLSSAFTQKTNPTCNASTDGELVVTPYFGVSPYSYAWSHDGGLNDSTATGLTAGNYSVTVTDALDSTAVAQYTLTEPDSFIFNPAITHVTTCSYSSEGAIDITITGGNGGNTYFWTSSEGGSEVGLTTEDQTGLTTGRYDVTVTDSEGCTSDTTIYITGPEPITFGNSVVTNYSSPTAKGAIDLVYEGGSGDPGSFSFGWEGPSGFTASTEDITDLDPGNYTVTATDVHICNFDTTFNVIDLDTFYVYISDYKDACNGTINGKATISYYSPKGHTDITYQWDANAGNQTTAEAVNLAPNRYYYVTVTDNENTPNSVMVDSVYIDELAYTFSGSISGSSSAILDCYGDTDGFIDVNITSAGETPYTYLWNTGGTTQDLTGLGIGTYSITATDANECQFTISNHEITQPNELLATAEIVSRPSCNGDYDGELTIERSGGTSPYSYQWNDPGSQTERNADGLDAGFYTVTVTDSKGCKKSSSLNLTEPAAIQAGKTIFNVSCSGGNDGAVQLSVSGGTTPFSYFWTTNNGSGLAPTNKDQSGLTAGKYYFSATDANNCLYEDSVEITEPLPLAIEETSVNDATCNSVDNGSIDITVSGGSVAVDYLYSWSTADGSGLVTDSEDQAALGAGTYDLTVTDDNGCEATTSITINEPTAISIEETAVSNISCNGLTDGSIDITVTGGTIATDYTFNWSSTNGTGYVADSEDQTGLSAGSYDLTVTDDNGCEATTSITINEPAVISIEETTVSDITCNGLTDGSIDITVTGGTAATDYTFNWSSTDGTGYVAADEDQTGLGAGTYNLTVTDDNFCEETTSIVITEPEALTIVSDTAINATSESAADGSVQVEATGGTGILTYMLTPGDIANETGIFDNLGPNEYTITITDENSCGPVTTNLTVSFPDAIESVSFTKNIKLYPNPTSAKIMLEIDIDRSDIYTIEILNISGQRLYKESTQSDRSFTKELDLSNYAKGIYFIKVSTEQFYYQEKVILQ